MKVYDCFTFFNELDLLEIRLNTLDPHVDFFVICESYKTFSGKDKPLYYKENKERFAKWNHKIIHIVAPSIETEDSFERAGHQKDYIRKSLKNLHAHDIVYFGDLDEVWTPQDIQDDRVYNLRQVNYSYYLNNRSSEEWIGTVVGRWSTIKTQSFNHWRAKHDNVLDDGGWHFTNMGGAEQIRKKLDAYDHQEFNNDDVKSQIEGRMERGEDYVGRGRDWQGAPFEFHTDEVDLPQYLKDNKEKWLHLFR